MSTALVRFEEARSQMQIDPAGKVRVCFEMDRTDEALEAVFECVSCGELLAWKRESSWWFCPSCGYELTIQEARKVVGFAQAKLGELAEAITGRGTEWRWVTWLRKLLQRKAV